MDAFFELLADDPVGVMILLGWGAFLLFLSWFIIAKWARISDDSDKDGGK